MLPKGWTETKLGEVAETKLGKMLDANKNKGDLVPYLRNVNVRWGAFDLSDLQEMRVTADERKALSVRDGDLFLCEGGEPGRCAVWRGGERNLVFQKALHRVRPLDTVEADYLARHIANIAAEDRLSHLFTGTTIKHLPQIALQRIEVPLPPLAEQRRIVAKLDTLTARLARARMELDRVPRLVANLRSQILSDAFQMDARGFTSLRNLTEDVRYGTAQKCDYDLGTKPVLRIPNVQRGRIDLDDLKSANFGPKEIAKLELRQGDILVIRSNGSLDLVGKSAVVDAEAEGMLYAGYLIRLRPAASKVDSRFLHHFLQSPAARELIASGARSSSGVNNVNAQQLQALPVPVRDLAEQKDIVLRIEAAFARADSLETEAVRARTLIDRLESAILAKAFRGELVPQDPTDEPAGVLLHRIRAQRASASKPKRGRRAAVSA